jgi:1,4-alpha-glucan branching enzyme
MAGATDKEVAFEFEAKQDSRVFIAGTFNNWNPSTHPLEYHPESGVFRATLLLEPGVHEYKFVVDGVWHADAKCPHWVINDSGTINSVIRV